MKLMIPLQFNKCSYMTRKKLVASRVTIILREIFGLSHFRILHMYPGQSIKLIKNTSSTWFDTDFDGDFSFSVIAMTQLFIEIEGKGLLQEQKISPKSGDDHTSKVFFPSSSQVWSSFTSLLWFNRACLRVSRFCYFWCIFPNF